MTPIEIKFKDGSSVAVIFIKNVMTARLSGVQKKMKEEVDELVPENFHFLSSWGPPIGRLHILMLRETSRSQIPKRKITVVEEAE